MMNRFDLMRELPASAMDMKAKNPELRDGQCFMNTLHKLDKEVYDHISGSDADPFYDDDKLSAAYSKILEIR